VLDSLAGADERRILGDRTLAFLDDALGFLDQALDGVALLARRLLTDRFEYGFECLDLTFGFGEVILEGGLQVCVAYRFDHLRQRLGDGVLGKVDVLQGVLERVGEGFHRVLQGRTTRERQPLPLVPL
jgi:hypothetical protein